MTDTDDQWDPDSFGERALLEKIHEAPHETRAVMRMHRAGKAGPMIMEALKITGQSMMKQLQLAMDEEGAAHRRKVPIHDARMPKGTK